MWENENDSMAGDERGRETCDKRWTKAEIQELCNHSRVERQSLLNAKWMYRTLTALAFDLSLQSEACTVLLPLAHMEVRCSLTSCRLHVTHCRNHCLNGVYP